MFKCAHCKGQHATAAEGRACSGVTTPAKATVGAASTTGPAKAGFPATAIGPKGTYHEPATAAQVGFIRSLASERVVPIAGKDQNEAWRIRIVECAQGGKAVTKSEASDAITWLKDQPKQPTVAIKSGPLEVPDVPAGHYAVSSATGNNDLDFFRVDRPTEGQWAGRTFVKRVIGGHPDFAVRGAQAKAALEAILEADPAKAAQRYGQEIGRCFKCNRHLTDETSRALGIGPECRKKG